MQTRSTSQVAGMSPGLGGLAGGQSYPRVVGEGAVPHSPRDLPSLCSPAVDLHPTHRGLPHYEQ